MQITPLRPYYHIFDLRTGKFLAKDGKKLVALEEFAGCWHPDEIDTYLRTTYGTTDRQILARKITLHLRS